MRPVYLRELKELVLPGAGLAVLAVAFGVEAARWRANLDECMLYVVLAGGLLGLGQGLLDQWRKRDFFFRHRPLSAGRFEVARTAGGLTVAAAAFGVFLLAHAIAFRQYELTHMQATYPMWLGPPRPLAGSEILLLGAVLAATWAVARFGTGVPRLRWAPLVAPALALAGWSWLSRAATLSGAALLAFGIAGLFAVGGGLALAGDRT